MAVTYPEMRTWARWLNIFTANDMAEMLGTPIEVGELACRALKHHGIVTSPGRIEEFGKQVRVYEYVPLPPGPTEHFTRTPPEIIAARQMGMEMFNSRGIAQRLTNDVKRRNLMSIPGQGHKARQRERRYQRMQEAVNERRTKQAAAARLNGGKHDPTE